MSEQQGDIRWNAPSAWGELEISINLTKPEKDPKAIAAAKARSASSCVLCEQNETADGWLDAYSEATRAFMPKLRIGDIDLDGELWRVQYSPYHYFEGHCIASGTKHVPMHIDRQTFGRLLDLVDAWPEFFMGANADLPIVGGSILAHDHFQGGSHVFPMDKAPVDYSFDLPGFPDVACGVVRWPLSVLRLSSINRTQLLDAATHVLDVWRRYDDDEAGIASQTDGVPHNTITPIARKRGGEYELSLALRCNITTEQHPLGMFHPHEELHHIKKENIGLIEVMGLAILPGRLKDELEQVAQALAAGAPVEGPHGPWATQVATAHPELNEENALAILYQEVGTAFAQVLDCSGVFKWDAQGRAALHRFIDAL